MVLVVMGVRGSRRKEEDGSVGEAVGEGTVPNGSAVLSWHIFLLFGLGSGVSSPAFDFSKGGRNFLSMAVIWHDAVSQLHATLHS